MEGGHSNPIAWTQLLLYHSIPKKFLTDHFRIATLLKRNRKFCFGLLTQ